MSPEVQIIREMGRILLRERLHFLATYGLTEEHEASRDRLLVLWDCYKMVYTRLFHHWPRFQLRFY